MEDVGRHMAGFFRPCSRCGRRTFWLCEDCGRPACPECATVEGVRVAPATLQRMRAGPGRGGEAECPDHHRGSHLPAPNLSVGRRSAYTEGKPYLPDNPLRTCQLPEQPTPRRPIVTYDRFLTLRPHGAGLDG